MPFIPRCLSCFFSCHCRHSQADRRANRTVRFNPHIRYRTIPGRSHNQGIDLQSLENTLRGGYSPRRSRYTPHPRRACRNPSRSASPNPFTPNRGSPMCDPRAFDRSPRDPPTPWAREVALPSGSPVRPPTTRSQWPPTTHIPQVNQNATPNISVPLRQVAPSQPPFVSASQPQINPVQPSRLWTPPVTVPFTPQTDVDSTPQVTYSWTPPVAVASTPQTNEDSTPQVTYTWTASITQPQNHPPPKLWTPLGSTHQMNLPSHSSTSKRCVPVPVGQQPLEHQRTQVESPVISQTNATSVPSTWGRPGNLRDPQVPNFQNESARVVPVAFPSGDFVNPRGGVPPLAPVIHWNRAPQRRHQSRTINPRERVDGFGDPLRDDQIDTLLTNGQLKWDIRLFSEMSTFSPARPYAPNLDSPALSNQITTALIEFKNQKLKAFNTQWGPIRVQSNRVSANNSATFISTRDIMEAIYKYIMKPITTQDKCLFILYRQQDEAFNVMFTMRTSIQGRLNDRPRRADLLPGNMVNFGRIVVDSVGGGMAHMRLVLY